jgi:hypothetical protein
MHSQWLSVLHVLLLCVPAGEYLLNVLVVNKPTYKGLIVPG